MLTASVGFIPVEYLASVKLERGDVKNLCSPLYSTSVGRLTSVKCWRVIWLRLFSLPLFLLTIQILIKHSFYTIKWKKT